MTLSADNWLLTATGNDSWPALLEAILRPLASVFLILFLAFVVSKLARRGLRRLARRLRSGDPGLLARIEERTGLDIAEDLDPVELQRRERRVDAMSALLGSVAAVVIWAVAILMVLSEFGLDLAPVLASAGIVGLAVGFGSQDLVKDLVAGAFVLAEDQYGVGDSIDSGEAIGNVEGITLRSTRIRDVNGTLWHVPNGAIRRVGNQSQKWARALIDVDVAYDTDADYAGRIVLDVAKEMTRDPEYADRFLDAPEMWGVQSLGADGVTLRLVVKVLPGTQFVIARQLRARIKRRLDELGIEIPFPQRTVWIRQDT